MSDARDSRRVAIIFADIIEARPLVRDWAPLNSSWLPKTSKAFETENAIAVVAGIGPKHAATAARAVVEEFSPTLMVSAGFAGGIDDKLEPPMLLKPTRVVNAVTGRSYDIDAQFNPSLTLVSSDHVVNEQGKRELARLYSAVAVDMEGATVAEIAHAVGVPFVAVKVVSERADFPMPPFDRYIGEDGHLQRGAFLAWAAAHPGSWGALITLARDSTRAAEALKNAVNEVLGEHFSELRPL